MSLKEPRTIIHNIKTISLNETLNVSIPSQPKNWAWTLNDYQHNILHNLSLQALIYQSSDPTGRDGWVPFPIGSVHRFTTALLKCADASFPFPTKTLRNKINKHPTNATFNHLVFIEMNHCFYENVLQTIPEMRNNTVFCGFNEGTDNHRRRNAKQKRSIFVETLKKNNIVNNMLKIDQFEFYRRLLNSKFIIAPEGNGIDCHRTYDSIIFGAIPVVESVHESKMREKYGNVPMLFTSNYSEITREYLEEIYPTMVNKMYDYNRMFIESYDMKKNKKQVKNIRKYGNYWVNRFTHVRHWMGDIMLPYTT